MGNSSSIRLLELEARALLTRLQRIKPFALQMPMVPAAAVSPAAQSVMEAHMSLGKQRLTAIVHDYLRWLSRHPEATAQEAQNRFTIVRMRFNAVLTQFDIFSDVLAQRSQHATGVWTAGLDAVAADALAPIAPFVSLPPIVCYLDRGVGAAIRRARTRLPGGDENPLAIIRVPRERMVGAGIAASLIHEVGHEAAAQIDVLPELRILLQSRQHESAEEPARLAWRMWERWISEIVADFWAVAHLGISATTGLLAVVSLPRPFVFRVALDDPHPFPWIRVKLSCAMGNALYPHPQWTALASIWESLYPVSGLPESHAAFIRSLEDHMPQFVDLLTAFQPEKLAGHTIPGILPIAERSPDHLRRLHQLWSDSPGSAAKARPTLAFAVIGQARADANILPEQESAQLADLLSTWALSSSLNNSQSSPCPHSHFELGEQYAIH